MNNHVNMFWSKYVYFTHGVYGEKCRALIQNGKNKGSRCNYKFRCKGHFCMRHYRMIYKKLYGN
uniref:Uncharacterized protein n=1 Tax=viral metagenome TaxID=1070528 RepID=A0A6C0JBQ4_9ZZZZ